MTERRFPMTRVDESVRFAHYEIDRIPMTTRTRAALLRANLVTFAAINATPDSQLLQEPNFGVVSLRELRGEMAAVTSRAIWPARKRP